jgi:beta-alanine degradation protein BauB
VTDPVVANPELYRVVMENERVRVLEYRDRPGDRTHSHAHPDSVMITASSFRRRLASGERTVELELDAGTVRWLDAQEHSGENSGASETHVFFVELKEAAPRSAAASNEPLGPVDS